MHRKLTPIEITEIVRMVEDDEMVLIHKEDDSQYCQILAILGMEEGGDAVAEVRRLVERDREVRRSRGEG